jgi:quinol monooxygenase YgiN
MPINWRFVLFIMMASIAAAPAWAQAPAAAPAQPAPAPAQPAPSGPAYAVTYFEVAPKASQATGNQLRQFAAAARKEAGNVEFLALRDSARAGRFAVVEAWKDKAALDAHGAATKALGEKLQANFAAPFDTRLFWTMAVAGPAKGADELPGGVYVLTHVDVFPAGKDQVAALLKQLVEDSRKDAGVLRYDAVIQDGRPNHFHLVEAWASPAARQAHALAEHTRQFRAKLVPFEGALYDERLYEAMR